MADDEVYDWEDFAPPAIVFRVGGKSYKLPELSAKLGIELAADKWEGRKVRELYAEVLGDVQNQMIADGVPESAMTRAGMVALADGQYGRTYALHLLKTGSHPEALAAAYAAAGLETPPQTQTDEEATTPSPSSGRGTRSPRKAPAKKTTSRSASRKS